MFDSCWGSKHIRSTWRRYFYVHVKLSNQVTGTYHNYPTKKKWTNKDNLAYKFEIFLDEETSITNQQLEEVQAKGNLILSRRCFRVCLPKGGSSPVKEINFKIYIFRKINKKKQEVIITWKKTINLDHESERNKDLEQEKKERWELLMIIKMVYSF